MCGKTLIIKNTRTIMNLNFNEQVVLSLLTSEKEFPINIEEAVKWLEYSSKQKAKNKLVNNFELGLDYIVVVNQSVESDNHGTSSPQELASKSRKEEIYLTVETFKQISMMSGTSRGKEVRKYFIDCEKKLKQQQETNQLILSGDVATTLFNFIQEQKQITSELMERTKKLDQIEEASKTHKGARAVIDSEDNEFEIKECVSVDQYLISLGLLEITPTSKNAIHRRAATFYRTDKHCEPKKLGNKNVYYGSEVEYIKQATKSVLGL
jgi:phage anti-repressor protein